MVLISFVCYYVSQVIGWEDYTLVISFMSKGFDCEDKVEELFIVMVSFFLFPTPSIFNFLINFNFY